MIKMNTVCQRRMWFRAIRLSGIIALLGCGNTEPVDPPTPDGGIEADYFPLVAGNTWTYRAEYSPGKTLVKTLSAPEPIPDDPHGRSAFKLTRTESDDPTDIRYTWMGMDNERLVRYRKEWWSEGVLKTAKVYDPPFVRVVPAQMRAGGTWDSGSITRTDYNGAGDVEEVATKFYTFEVLSIDEVLTVEGQDLNCIKFRRLDSEDGDNKEFWFAAGIGKVKEWGKDANSTGIEDDEVETLIGYNVTP